jgi:hypothetical protein
MPWKRLLKSLQAAELSNNKVKGMTFTDPTATTVTLVRDYLRVARYGTVEDIAQAIGRHADGLRGVRGICESLVGAGELEVTETLTRGPMATKRRTYRTREGAVWTNTLPDDF